MFKWAFKSLFSQPGALIGAILGIAGTFILVVFFRAVWQGESDQIIAYPNQLKPDVWVMQKGVENMHMAMSSVWDFKADAIRQLPQVKRVTPILYLNSVVAAGDKKLFAFVVGLLQQDDRAGPSQITKGRKIANTGEIIVPDVLSALAKLSLGDTIDIADKSFDIVAFSGGTYSAANPVFFVRFEDLQDILSSFGTYSYLLVDSHKGIDSEKLAATIRAQINKVNALTHEVFIANDFALAKQMGVEIIATMTLICAILAALIIGYSSYALVIRRKTEIAILKALGATNSAVFVSVIFQSVIVMLLAFAVVLVFALFVLPFIPDLLPQITIKIAMADLVSLAGIALFVSVIGAFLPAYRVVGLDPAIAFQH